MNQKTNFELLFLHFKNVLQKPYSHNQKKYWEKQSTTQSTKTIHFGKMKWVGARNRIKDLKGIIISSPKTLFYRTNGSEHCWSSVTYVVSRQSLLIIIKLHYMDLDWGNCSFLHFSYVTQKYLIGSSTLKYRRTVATMATRHCRKSAPSATEFSNEGIRALYFILKCYRLKQLFVGSWKNTR